jgi:hypothetical protein
MREGSPIGGKCGTKKILESLFWEGSPMVGNVGLGKILGYPS